MDAYLLISFGLFFVIHFVLTQKIYSHNYFLIALLFSLLIPLISFLLFNRDEWIKSIPAALLVFIFVALLFVVKMFYKKLNKLLVAGKLIKKEYEEKDFTYVLWDSDVNIPDWWDKKLTSKPSWFDHLITLLLLVLPILLMAPLKRLIEMIS